MLADALPYLYLFGAGLVAGTVNVLAGGGSALTLPLLIFLGLPPTVANGTNRIAILAQNAAAVAGFRREGFFEGRWLLLAGPPALGGTALGAWAALSVGDELFQRILAALMVGIALWLIWRPFDAPGPGTTAAPPADLGRRALLGLGFFGAGIYAGFVQAGLGFLVLALTSAVGLDLVRGNAMKVLLAVTITPLALWIFSMGDAVEWIPGLALAAGMVVGALAGVRLTVLKGHEWIRKVVTAAVVIFAVRLWWTA